ncbi:1,2-phenylacetyl-CoA epoxidase subunit PaaE [Arthrobacter antibioticus]|uniref:1,2-phenylacetyl-CoA epoxidase subunit PaaE n=1 Tax=Arthrobacter sp. H35-MC1 TaxID=3046203 RepID=UPI0024B9CFE6|nr:1,2-phenylacetyl-CoA epoxidase subunit PaaE [Arthrobacter sp. H35-MC1]MDJ0316894.1 phenylacetate-CoA oxygenase/reductase subunit PaaK [Arthrobacter sp. H35-MC1]
MSVPVDATARRRAAFHALSVSRIRPLTDDSVEVTFAVPAELAGFYDYLPGQYVALRVQRPGADGVGREIRRSYSICALPTHFADGSAEIQVAIKRDIGGEFSTWATTELSVGTVLEVMSPMGAFISRHGLVSNVLTGLNQPESMAGQVGTYVAIAAGSGITPVMALAKSLLAGHQETRLDLIYANKATMDVMFLEELADLKDRYPQRFAIHHVLSREQRISPLLSGRLDAAKLEALLGTAIHSEEVDEWFLCGPFELVQLCRDLLEARGIPREKVRFELFSTGRPDRPEGQIGHVVPVDDSKESYRISFTLDGLKTTVLSPTHARESVLNAALRVRADVPFACTGGVCGTCRAKVVKGAVEMSENYALEPDELAAGYVLTCQSHPTTAEVDVDYDV